MEKILISACLVGEKTRYDGKSNLLPIVEKLKERYDLIPFCPEVMGGMSIPRDPCEIKGNDVVTKDGVSKAKEYNLGAKKALEACKLFDIRIAILMESSPSCGVRNIHDGHFNGTKIPGKGLTTRLLEANGIHCYSSLDDLSFLIKENTNEGKEYLSYEERVALLKERRNGRKGSFGKKPFKRKPTEEKPVSENESVQDSNNESIENGGEKKQFTKRPFKKSFHHDGERKSFSHRDGERRPFKKGDGKRPFRKDDGERKFHHDDNKFHGEKRTYGEKKSYGSKKSYGAKKSYGDRKSYGNKGSYGKGSKRSLSKGNYHKTDKKSA